MWLRVLILLAGLCFFPMKSFAVTCTLSAVPNVNFSAVNPFATADSTTSITFNYTCTKTPLVDLLAGYTICFNIGATGSNTINSRKMTGPSGATLNYQLYYQDSGGTRIIWGNEGGGSGTSPKDYMNLLNLTSISGSLTVYATLPAGQSSAIPGTYTDTYSSAVAYVSVNGSVIAAPTTCSATSAVALPIVVTATVNKQCNVSAANNINLGSNVSASQTNITASNTFTMACTNTTAYTIGLSPSNNSTTGSGVMKSTTAPITNTDQVAYQLNSTAGVNGLAWGNGTTNLVSGNGTGLAVNRTVYAVAPSANYKPDSYADTVTINVTY